MPIIYFAVGGGKFLGQFLGINDKLAGILLILFALIYTTLSGFYGVVFTDIFQGIFIFIAILYICFLAMTTVNLPDNFVISLPGTTQVQQWNLSEWSSIIPPTKLDLPGDYAIFNLFAGAILFYLFKVFLQRLIDNFSKYHPGHQIAGCTRRVGQTDDGSF